MLTAATMLGCVASVPRDIDNSCRIFEEKRSWYHAATLSYRRWGVPIPVQLAIIHQESRFRARARPPRRKILWVIPGPRPSTAAGYTQALTTTWNEYVRDSGNWGADRDDFADAADFIGWYGDRSAKRAGIAKGDAYSLYLAYHEGDGGFVRRTYGDKDWLKSVAAKVSRRATIYGRQLAACEEELQPRWWQVWLR